MGYYLVIGICVGCRRMFSYNPLRVPALVINGEREAVCRSCAERWNVLHPEIARPILPGAYDPIADDGTAEPWDDEA